MNLMLLIQRLPYFNFQCHKSINSILRYFFGETKVYFFFLFSFLIVIGIKGKVSRVTTDQRIFSHDVCHD